MLFTKFTTLVFPQLLIQQYMWDYGSITAKKVIAIPLTQTCALCNKLHFNSQVIHFL